MISREIKKIQQRLANEKLRNIRAVILYGSWVKGTAREDSDVDLLAIYRRRDKKTSATVNELVNNIDMDRDFTVVHALQNDFIKEKWPVYTAAKAEGRVIFGDIDLSRCDTPPPTRYSEFFKTSRDFESRKVELAEKFLKGGLTSGVIDHCFIASKHAVQAALAMRGKGFSSKMNVLLPLAKECFGTETAQKLRKLYELYKRSEAIFTDITKKDAKLAVRYAKDVLKVYDPCPAACNLKS